MNSDLSNIENEKFKQELKDWAKDVVPYCDKIARTKTDCGEFYAFQSAPKKKPNVLLLVLNPRDEYNCTYQAQCEGKNMPDGMTIDFFINGNSFYSGKTSEEATWTILKGFEKTKNIQHQDFKDEFDNMMYMNILYFSSINFDDFKRKFKENWKEVFEKCADFTKFLIFEIIKPTKIICLGAECFPKFIGKEKFSILNGIVKKTTINNIPVYGIDHPSYRFLSDAKRVMTGWILANDWFGAEIPDKIESINPVKINPQEIVEYFRKKPLSNKVSEDKEEYRELLYGFGLNSQERGHWLGIKKFKDYGENITEKIESTIKEFMLILKEE